MDQKIFSMKILLFVFGFLTYSVISIHLDDVTFRDVISNYLTSNYGSINNWKTSQVTNMSEAFLGASNFNSMINSWNVSRVTSMDKMFYNSESFNSSLNNWDVSRVTNFFFMFGNARSFNRDLNKWFTSNASNMAGMFYSAYSFNGDISTWDVSKVTDMYSMFEDASSFNGIMGQWDVGKTTRFDYMFFHSISFDQSLCWPIGENASTKRMFDGTTSSLAPYLECSKLPQLPVRIIINLRTINKKDYCIHPANNFVNVGTKIGISTCKSWKSFQWNIDVEGKIHSNLKPELCIHMKGKRIFLQNCIDGSKNILHENFTFCFWFLDILSNFHPLG
jgi:surface protein